MAKIRDVAEGLQILSKYATDEFSIAAEHDVIYAGHGVGEDTPNEEDRKRLDELGWFYGDPDSWKIFV